ncbi:beta strand repeat-containing protein [Paraburkholderia phenazinium]|uniref:Head domain of trimeric autotransporter adhesin n=1 Tax=Paraburkholderia phenazinium TaxID=60549 RepID=A0A1G8CU50_9BURK|nr:YadA-like family protein [Paraburkholderia phenazinium]SDH49005.1 Head domain of trimeric autotransporter adhesin [Paraburkholderia phenazinium]
MNKSYKSVWNETTGTYVAASEVTKSRGKASRNSKVLAAALLAAGVGFGTAVKSEAATPNSFAAGILGNSTSNSDCISSADGAQVVTSNDCSATTQRAGIVSYDGSGNAGAYFTVTDPNTAHIGAGGVDQMLITNTGVAVLNGINMSNTKISNLAAGAVSASSTDAVNGSQLYAVSAIANGLVSPNTSVPLTAFSKVSNGNPVAPQISTSAADAIAIGSGSFSTGSSTSLGTQASASGNSSSAFGFSSAATGAAAVAVGMSATASGSRSVAVGASSSATGTNSVALGLGSLANRDNTVSVGTSSSQRQIVNVAAGTQGTDAVNYAQLQAAGLKTDSSGNATNSFVAYDNTTQGKVTLGGASGTTITNVTAGAVSASSTDAVNGSQLYGVSAIANNLNSHIALSPNSTDNMNGLYAVSAAAVTGGSFDAVAVGGGSLANNRATAVGTLAQAAGVYATALGDSAYASATASLAAGTSSAATGAQAVAMGASASASASGAAVLGSSAAASQTNSLAIGTRSNASAANSVALGAGSTTTADLTALAYNPGSNTLSGNASSANGEVSVASAGKERRLTNVAAGASATDAVNVSQLQSEDAKINAAGANTASALGGGAAYTASTGAISAPTYNVAGGTQHDVGTALSSLDSATVQFNGVGGAADVKGNKIVNVAAGAVSASSTDAVNGSQLYAQASSTAAALGGGSSVNADGTVSAPAYSVDGATVSNVGAAISNLDGRVTTNATDIGTLNTKVDTINGQIANAVSYDTSAHDTVTLAGASGTKLSNVAAGAVSASSTDAVNGSQLYAQASSTAAVLGGGASVNADGTVSAPAYSVDGTTVNNVGEAISNLDGRVTTNTTAIGTLATQMGTINGQIANAVSYDTSAHDTVTFNGTAGTTLSNVKAGVADMDAVNIAQLKAAGLSIDDSGNATNSFVAYDDATKGKISLGGGTAGTTLTNVSVGALSASSTDAVNGSQLYATNQNVSKNTDNIANLDTRVTGVEDSVADLSDQINTGAVGLVQQDATSGALTVASKTGGTSFDFTGTAGARELLGVAAGTTSTSAVNLGQLSPVVASLGGGAQINPDGSIVSPTYHMQAGTQNTVGGALDTLDQGLNSLKTQINSGADSMVAQDSTSRDILVGATTDGLLVNMAGTAGNRVVTGVAAGAVNAASVDAVNGSQMYSHAVSTASALGGGSTVNADGTVSAPAYSVGGTTVSNVGAAITNLDGRVSQNTNDIASLQTAVGTISGSVANVVSYDTSAHNQVTLGGTAGAPAVKLTNLQDGELSATSTDAVTGAQLWNTNQQLSNLSQAMQNEQQTGNTAMSINAGDQPAAAATGSNAVAMGGGSQASGSNAVAMGGGAQASGDNSVAIGSGSVADQANTVSVGSEGNERRITNVAAGTAPTDAVNLGQMQSAIGDTARAAYSGVAAATALTMIPEVDPGKTLAVGIAGGSYKGYQAAAIGASARITQNLKVKIGAGISGSETTVGAGASYQW